MRFRLMLAWLVVAVVVTCALPLFAQYTDSAAVNELGGPQELARRRSELAKQVEDGVSDSVCAEDFARGCALSRG